VRGKDLLLACSLFLLTLFTCVTVGAVFLIGARTDVTTELGPFLEPATIVGVWSDPDLLRWGLAYALPLLTILLAHELGHYFVCRRHRLPASLPYFLPSPVLIGTFGAFIRIRGAMREKRQLFDVGIAGPIAGFAALLPFLIYGVANSSVQRLAPVADGASELFLTLPGQSLLYRALVWSFHGGLPAGSILNPHPFVFAAWVGCFVTMLNLLPLSQLDGGHILYAVLGRAQRRVTLVLWLGLFAAGFLWTGWFVWSAIVLVLGLRHPPISNEDEPLGSRRRALAVLAALIFLLTFMPVPLAQVPFTQP
jgi:membrane-associated protease RseP (regulator of RpoE activity)